MQDGRKLLIDHPQQSGANETPIAQNLNQRIVTVMDIDRSGASQVRIMNKIMNKTQPGIAGLRVSLHQ
jgi:hypothetical protein